MSGLPTQDDLEKLPIPAIVAFAARCARRVQPMFALASNIEKHAKFVRAVDNAIEVAEAATRVADTAYAVARDASRAAAHDKDAAHAAHAATYAAYAAFIAQMGEKPKVAAYGVQSIDDALAIVGRDGQEAILADFNRLQTAVGNGTIDSGSRVPPGYFGPMWPAGEPDWYVRGMHRTREILSQPEKVHEIKAADAITVADQLSVETNDPRLPTAEQLADLSHSSITKIAIRSARRCQPLFRVPVPDDRYKELAVMLDDLLSLLERISSSAGSPPPSDELTRFGWIGNPPLSNYRMPRRAKESARFAALAAASAASSTVSESTADAINLAANAIKTSIAAIRTSELDVASNAVEFGKAVHQINADFAALKEGRDPGPLWPDGEPEWFSEGMAWLKVILTQLGSDSDSDADRPDFVLVWDPHQISEEEYAELVKMIGDIVRDEGGIGVERIRSDGFGIEIGQGVLNG